MDEVYFRRSVFKSKNSGEKMVRGQPFPIITINIYIK